MALFNPSEPFGIRIGDERRDKCRDEVRNRAP